jgi:hypothetical protein
MLGLAFKSLSDYLAKLLDSLEDWHVVAPIRGNTQLYKLLFR